MIGLLKDGWNAPNKVISDCGWGALIVTAIVVLGLWLTVPGLDRVVPLWTTVVFGGAIQGLTTFALAGLRMRNAE
jgi:hypothetical protein